MKRILQSFIFIVLLANNISAQDHDRIIQGKTHFKKIIELIKNERILQLADLIKYPLRRPDPVPNVETKESFLFYYSTLFDDSFKQMILDTTQSFTDIYVNPYSYEIGFNRGKIYIDEDGRITGINYSSPKELELQQTLNKETLSLMNPGIKKWKQSILVLKSDNYLIRVDLMEDNSLRYISWSNPKKISDKPDLILFNGIQKFQGTMGGVIYSFKNGDWTYTVDYVALCNEIDNCGYFLKLSQKGEEKKSIKMTRIK